MRRWLVLVFACGAAAAAGGQHPAPDPATAGELASAESASERPNVLVVFTDDQGWADLGVQGAQGFTTPHLDRLANEGLRFTHARVPSAVCTPSRAALLTGRHPIRHGLGDRVVFPYQDHGLPPEEVTLAEVLRAHGYRTACVGKWHLGHARPELMPNAQGFDHWFGVPYSNDMDGHHYRHNDFQSPPLPLWRNGELVEEGPEQSLLTQRFTDEALCWIREAGEQPWFLYLAHVMPHLPLSVSEEFAGSSELGLYGDVIQEIDATVGRLLAGLEELGMAEDTIVIFASDNGPWRRDSAGPLRGRKNTTWEGGHRTPLLVRWPAGLPAGRVMQAPCSTLDLLPTLCALTGAPRPTWPVDPDMLLPAGQAGSPVPLDGRDLSAWWRGGEPPEPRPVAYYDDGRLEAVALGMWKLHLVKQDARSDDPPMLFQLQQRDLNPVDVGEQHDLAPFFPKVLADLTAEAERFRAELGDRAEPVERLTAARRAEWGLPEIDAHRLTVRGVSIVGSEQVDEIALREAAWLMRNVTRGRPELLGALAEAGVRIIVIANEEKTTDRPEYANLVPRAYWNVRARGFGPSPGKPYCSVGEEDLLCHPNRPAGEESIFVHEFAHALHAAALTRLDEGLQQRLEACYAAAMEEGLWEGKYAASNPDEYWAEGVQSWFGTNRAPDHDHNHVDTRAELRVYDPRLCALIDDALGPNDWRYTPVRARLHLPHLWEWDPATAPVFVHDPEERAAFTAQRQARAWLAAGFRYRDGRGVELDAARAADYFRRAAEAGDPEGQDNWGWMLWTGRGIDRDAAAAEEWFRKSAEQGHAQGMWNLAQALRARGAEDEARAWLVKAAGLGHAAAARALER